MRLLSCSLLLAAFAVAQTPTEPPVLIQLIRKAGVTSTPVRAYSQVGASLNVMGMTAITGEPESWALEIHDSFAGIEALDKALAPLSSLSATNRTMVAAYRPGWSYRPDQAIKLFPRARYFQVQIFQIRLGTDGDFGELIRLRHASQESVNRDRPSLTYQVISGAPSGTYVFLAPLATLAALDDEVAAVPTYAQGVAEAAAKARAKLAPEIELTRESLLLRVEPRLSYISYDFAAADPNFWGAPTAVK